MVVPKELVKENMGQGSAICKRLRLLTHISFTLYTNGFFVFLISPTFSAVTFRVIYVFKTIEIHFEYMYIYTYIFFSRRII